MPKKKVVAGAPEIAQPRDDERWERQMAFVTAWFLEMLERIRLNDDKQGQPGHEARLELQTLLLETIEQILRVAQTSDDSPAKKWAGELLAIVYQRLRKHDRKLKANAAYAEMEKKLSGKSLTAVLFPKGRVQRIVQRELKKAERNRNKLLLLKLACTETFVRFRKRMEKAYRNVPDKDLPLLLLEGCRNLREAAQRQRIPEVYLSFVKLQDFSVKSLPQWEKKLSPLIMKKIDVSKMPSLKARAYEAVQVTYDVRTGRPPVMDGGKKNRKRYASDLGIHDTLQLLARLRDAGIYQAYPS